MSCFVKELKNLLNTSKILNSPPNKEKYIFSQCINGKRKAKTFVKKVFDLYNNEFDHKDKA